MLYPEQIMLDAAAATGASTALLVEDFTNITLSLNTANSTNATIKFVGSLQDTPPDFAAAQSVTNRYDYIEVIDLEDGSAIDGDTGIALAGTDDHRLLKINTDHLKWVGVVVTAYAAGNITVYGKPSQES